MIGPIGVTPSHRPKNLVRRIAHSKLKHSANVISTPAPTTWASRPSGQPVEELHTASRRIQRSAEGGGGKGAEKMVWVGGGGGGGRPSGSSRGSADLMDSITPLQKPAPRNAQGVRELVHLAQEFYLIEPSQPSVQGRGSGR